MKTFSLALAAIVLPLAAAAATVDLDSTRPGGNAGMLYSDGSGYYLDGNDTNPGDNSVVYLSLDAGTYEILPTRDLYTSWSRWRSSNGCDASGKSCTTGFEHSFAFFLPDSATAGSGGLVDEVRNDAFDASKTNLVNYSLPFTPAFFKSGEDGYDDVAGTVMARFTLDSAQQVGFYIHDNVIRDNRGGVSLEVSAVPLPAGLPLLLAGLGGLAILRRKAA